MRLDRAAVVFRKEVVDNLRDRRALASALLYPLFGPLLLVLIMVVAGSTFSERAEQPLELPVAGGEHAPDLISFLRRNGAEIAPPPADPEAAVRAGEVEVVLVIPEGYAAALAAGRPAPARMVVDDSRTTAVVSVRRLEALLEGYGQLLATQRLLARGVAPEVIRPLAVERRDVSTPQSQGAQFLAMAPYFLIFSIFIGGMYLAIDATAGERERGSLEPLLLNPPARWEVLLGKYGAGLLFTLAAVVVTLLGFAVALNLLPLEDTLGVRLSMGAGALAGTFLLCLSMAPLAVALQVLIGNATRSYKEAQTYLSLLVLVPALPGLFLSLLPVKTTLGAMLVPTYGQQLLINQLLRGEAPELLHLAVSTLVTLLAAALVFLLAARLYAGERGVLGR